MTLRYGKVEQSLNSGFTGRIGVLRDIETTLATRYGIKSSGMAKIAGQGFGKVPSDQGESRHLNYCKSQSKRDLYHFMYDNATYFLSRKKRNFNAFLRTRPRQPYIPLKNGIEMMEAGVNL